MKNKLTCIAAIAFIGLTAPVAMAQRPAASHSLFEPGVRSETFQSGLCVALAIDATGQLELSTTSLVEAQSRRFDRPRRVVWSGPLPSVDRIGRIDALTTSNGTLQVVADIHGGGTRFLAVWSIPEERQDGRVASMPRLRVVQSLALTGNAVGLGSTDRLGVDLVGPTLVELGGELYVVGSVQDEARPGLVSMRSIFIAKWDDLGRPSVKALDLGFGDSPRATVLDGELVIAFRRTSNASELHGDASLGFLRSRDGETFRADEARATDLATPSQYELTVHGGKLYVARERVDEVDISTLEGESGEWHQLARMPVSAHAGAAPRMWFQPEIAGTRPTLLLRDGDRLKSLQ